MLVFVADFEDNLGDFDFLAVYDADVAEDTYPQMAYSFLFLVFLNRHLLCMPSACSSEQCNMLKSTSVAS